MMGLHEAFRPDAVWIGSEHPFDVYETYLCFRSPADWRIEELPRRAELFITADSRYRVWINGGFVARGPSRCYPERQSVDCIDVTAHLVSGANTLAVQVYQPGYSHFAYVHRGVAGLLASLVGDGHVLLTTGTSWRVRRDPSFAERVPRISIYGSGVEERDLRLVDDWAASSYQDSHWSAARLVAPVGGYPWLTLQLRSLPQLVEREQPISLLETRRGRYPEELRDDAHLALRAGWFAASASGTPPSPSGWIQVELEAGQAAYWLYDLGRDYACQGWVEVRAALGRERVSVSYAEQIRDGQLVISDPQTYCRVRLTDRYRLRPGDQMAEPFAMRGGRYLLLQLSGPTGGAFRLRVHVRVSEYPLEVSRPVGVSDAELAEITELCETTFLACLQDGFVDSTWRESSQWLGDALPQSLIMASMSDDVRPLRQVIEMAAEGAYPDGVLPSVLPGEAHAYTVVDYNFIWVELLNLYWRLTSDRALVDAMWPVLVKMMERFHQDLNLDGLIISQPGRRLFLDWAPLSRREPNAVYNLHYLLALQVAAHLAHEVAAVEDAACWEARAVALGPRIREAFWQRDRWYDDLERTTFSQLGAALAVLTGCATPDEAQGLLNAIISRSLDLTDAHRTGRMVLASPFMHHYLFQALRKSGKSEAVVEIIKKRWGRWVRSGYPTAWENWDVDFPDGSQCHAFSAHPRYHLAAIAADRGGV
ncbi:MAG: alpha-L-rhamnosidase N-terminal domain-containing protein [Anaerolineales bacterium]|nr:MAG: alpha-L-rhamnosidase N-terminal domain-containing protein [Anaerolineales bacterium]